MIEDEAKPSLIVESHSCSNCVLFVSLAVRLRSISPTFSTQFRIGPRGRFVIKRLLWLHFARLQPGVQTALRGCLQGHRPAQHSGRASYMTPACLLRQFDLLARILLNPFTGFSPTQRQTKHDSHTSKSALPVACGQVGRFSCSS